MKRPCHTPRASFASLETAIEGDFYMMHSECLWKGYSSFVDAHAADRARVLCRGFSGFISDACPEKFVDSTGRLLRRRWPTIHFPSRVKVATVFEKQSAGLTPVGKICPVARRMFDPPLATFEISSDGCQRFKLAHTPDSMNVVNDSGQAVIVFRPQDGKFRVVSLTENLAPLLAMLLYAMTVFAD